MFWGNKELEKRLPGLITPYEPDRLDRANYKLRIGDEVYVSPTGIGSDNKLKAKKQLESDEDFQIPPGQIALLLTHESVSVPNDAVAFISMRATYKFKGLVNISGFHVDPGFKGRLMFSVFNAGPSAVHLEAGEECFHIWYADLRDSVEFSEKPGYKNIPPSLVGQIAEGMQTFSGLDSKIDDVEKRLSEKVVAVQQENIMIKTTMAVILTLGLALLLKDFSGFGQRAEPARAQRAASESIEQPGNSAPSAVNATEPQKIDPIQNKRPDVTPPSAGHN